MLLVYYKVYITHTLSSSLFDLDQSNVHRDIRYMGPLVKKDVFHYLKSYTILQDAYEL